MGLGRGNIADVSVRQYVVFCMCMFCSVLFETNINKINNNKIYILLCCATGLHTTVSTVERKSINIVFEWIIPLSVCSCCTVK